MADQVGLDTPALPQAAEPRAAEPSGVRFSRKQVSLSAMADSLAGGGASAGASMAQSSGGSAASVASQGFSGAAHEVPHRAEMEQSFGGADFSGVKAYSDAPALKANSDLGAHAYASGDSIAFSSPNPSKSLVAHELTHVVQQGGAGGPQMKSDGGGGVDTSGEAEAERVESAVASGRPALSALDGGRAPRGPATKKGPARKGDDNKWTAGMTFSPEGFELSGKYELWSPSHKFEMRLDEFVPGLSFRISPDVSVVGAVGKSKKEGEEEETKIKLGVEGGLQMDLAYGVPELAQLYGGGTATLSDGFEFTKKGHDWQLTGGIGLSTALVCGLNIGNDIVGHFDYQIQLAGTDIGKLTGLDWKNGKFIGHAGWEWSDNMKALFASIRRVVDKAMAIAKMGIEAAKAAYNGLKTGGQKVFQAGAAVANWVSSW